MRQQFDPPPSLAEFLLARLREDRRRIYACDSDGKFRATWVTFRRRDGSMDYTTVAAGHGNDVWVANGTAYQSDSRVSVGEPFFDAARVLADLDAKRRIVELHSDRYNDGGCTGCGFGSDEERMNTVEECPTLHLLALPYASHNEFRDEWLPES